MLQSAKSSFGSHAPFGSESIEYTFGSKSMQSLFGSKSTESMFDSKSCCLDSWFRSM